MMARIGRRLGAKRVELTPEQYEKALMMNISGRSLQAGDVTREQLRAIGVDVGGETSTKKSGLSQQRKVRDRVVPDGTPMTISKMREFSRALREGAATPEGIKANWESFNASREDLRAELSKKTMKQLEKVSPNYHREKKAQLVENVLNQMEMDFIPGNFISYSPIPQSSWKWDEGLAQRNEQSKRDAFAREVGSWTPEKIVEKAERTKKAIAERDKRRAQAQKAIDNPETLEDFRTFFAIKGRNAMTPEQARRYDAVSAEASRSARREQEQAAKAQRVASTTLPSGVGVEIKKAWHAKKQHDLYVATLSDRVDRDSYNELNARAKSLGGYYSKYSKNGAIPGFQFQDEATAKKFAEMGQATIEKPDTTEVRQKKAAEQLREKADRMEERASDALAQDRLANTARRARMAASADDAARSNLATAKTMRAIADALESGQAKYLDRMSTRVDIEQVSNALRHSHFMAAGDKYPDDYRKREEHRNSGPTEEDADTARYPYPRIYTSNLRTVERDGIPGVARAVDRLKKAIARSGGNSAELTDSKDIEAIESLVRVAGDKMYGPSDDLADYKRMQRLDIKTEPEYREMLREFAKLQTTPEPRTQIKEMERNLVGRKIPGYFPTPPAVVDRALALADVQPGQRVLEPSAGKGNIAERLRDATGDRIDTVEIDSDLTGILEAKGFTPRRENFLSMREGNYDRIVMNPPFEKGQDMDHVQHAYELLAPGGRIVSVMSEGGFFRSDNQSKAFRDWAGRNGGYSERLPQGSFKTSENPTSVNTRLFVIEKPYD